MHKRQKVGIFPLNINLSADAMSKTIELGVERDHIESQTKANGITAISELIWNSLDADATEINIDFAPNGLGGYQYISISDNGHGLTYEKAQDVFSRLGGSEKKMKTLSPGGRAYHGKEGRGRYKSLALGDLVEFSSTYQAAGKTGHFTIDINRNQISRTEISDLTEKDGTSDKTGFRVTIHNVNAKNASQALDDDSRAELEERFASYWIVHPFKVFFNGQEVSFRSIIKKGIQQEVPYEAGNTKEMFMVKVIEWTIENKRKTYLCNKDGIPFMEINIGIRSALPISVFIQSEYIESQYRRDRLDFWENDEIINYAYKESKNIARQYVRDRMHHYSGEFISELKQKDLYPYKGEAENQVEATKRQVFDIVALQINEFMPSFSE
jgi:hypothetical protein